MSHVPIDNFHAQADFRACYKRGMSAAEMNILVENLCKKYTSDDIIDDASKLKAQLVRDHIRSLAATELAFDQCTRKYEIDEQCSTQPKPSVIVFFFPCDVGLLIQRLTETGFKADYLKMHTGTRGGLLRLQRK